MEWVMSVNDNFTTSDLPNIGGGWRYDVPVLNTLGNPGFDTPRLKGETVTDVSFDDCTLILKTKSGKEFVFYHYQDYDEVVKIQSTSPNLHDFSGEIVDAFCVVIDCSDSSSEDTKTLTSLTIKTNTQTAEVKWMGIGGSGLYYTGLTLSIAG